MLVLLLEARLAPSAPHSLDYRNEGKQSWSHH